MGRDGAPGRLRGRGVLGGDARIQLRRVRVEPQADLASPLLDEGGEPVCERWAQPLTLDLRPGARRELRHAAAGDRDPLARPGVHALARAALGDAELAEAGEADLLAPGKRVGDPVEHRLDGVGRGLLRLEAPGDPVDELSLGQCDPSSSFSSKRRRNLTTNGRAYIRSGALTPSSRSVAGDHAPGGHAQPEAGAPRAPPAAPTTWQSR